MLVLGARPLGPNHFGVDSQRLVDYCFYGAARSAAVAETRGQLQ
jgi:hypothetical protein